MHTNVGKPEGKIPLSRRRHRCENNIKKCFKKVGCQGSGHVGILD
jgi:hypothetical protein